MGKKSPKAPAAPDPIATANAQGAANAEAARLNQRNSMVSQYTPYGNLIYTETAPDRWAAEQTLSPDQQTMLNQDNALGIQMNNLASMQLGRASNSLSTPVDYSGATPYAQGVQPVNLPSYQQQVGSYRPADIINTQRQDTQRIADLMNQRESGRMNAQREGLRTQMINQGIREGTDAWKRGMDDWNRQQNDFQIGAQLAAGQEQGRLFNEDMALDTTKYNQFNQHHQLAQQQALQAADWNRQNALTNYGQQQDAANYQNQLRQSQIAEMMAQRNAPLNEIASLMGGSQIQNPNYVNAPGYQQQAAPVADSIYGSYEGKLNQYNQQLQQQAQQRQGIYGLLGSGLGAAGMFFGK